MGGRHLLFDCTLEGQPCGGGLDPRWLGRTLCSILGGALLRRLERGRDVRRRICLCSG